MNKVCALASLCAVAQIVGFNSGLIALGVAGVLPPTTTALLHNGSTILISVNSMKNLLE